MIELPERSEGYHDGGNEMTRLETFLKMFPGATLDSSGYPCGILPCSIVTCPYEGIGCDNDCEEKFWNEEVKFKVVE